MTTLERLNPAKVDKWDLLQIESYLNISPKDFKLLMEAYRRKNVLDDTVKSIDSMFLGNGTPHEYKSKFFTPKGGVAVPKVNNWYGLTKSGKDILLEIEKIFPATSDPQVKTKLNRLLFNYK